MVYQLVGFHVKDFPNLARMARCQYFGDRRSSHLGDRGASLLGRRLRVRRPAKASKRRRDASRPRLRQAQFAYSKTSMMAEAHMLMTFESSLSSI